MFQRFFISLLNKPKEIKNLYAFWTAVSFTGVVALVWVSLSFSGGFMAVNDEGGSGEMSNIDYKKNSLFSNFIDEAKDKYSEMVQTTETVNDTNNPFSDQASSQAASVINTRTGSIELSPEEIEAIKQKQAETSLDWALPTERTNSSVASPSTYQEIQIIPTKTSQASTTASARETTGNNSVEEH